MHCNGSVLADDKFARSPDVNSFTYYRERVSKLLCIVGNTAWPRWVLTGHKVPGL